MRRHPLVLVTAAALTLTIALQVSPSWPAAAQLSVPFCPPGQPPAFVAGIAALRARLGEAMGAPLECEHVDAESGDTIQRTTTGLAYYRPSINTAIFTDGASHWALAEGNVIRWQGPSVIPPQPTDTEASYLRTTSPVRARGADLQRRLAGARQRAASGQIESLNVDELRTLVNDLRASRDALAAARGAGRLWRYHGQMVVSLNEGMAAAELLTQARQVAVPDLRTRLLESAAAHRQESERLRSAAQDAYGQVLPVVIDR